MCGRLRIGPRRADGTPNALCRRDRRCQWRRAPTTPEVRTCPEYSSSRCWSQGAVLAETARHRAQLPIQPSHRSRQPTPPSSRKRSTCRWTRSRRRTRSRNLTAETPTGRRCCGGMNPAHAGVKRWRPCARPRVALVAELVDRAIVCATASLSCPGPSMRSRSLRSCPRAPLVWPVASLCGDAPPALCGT